MGKLDSELTDADLEKLIEAVGEWESTGNQEYHFMNAVKNSIMPPEDSEAFEFVKMVKEHFKKREKDIQKARMLRQESATFLKAKLMLMRQDRSITGLFEGSSKPVEEPAEAEAEVDAHVFDKAKNGESLSPVQKQAAPTKVIDNSEEFQLTVEFMQKYKIYSYYCDHLTSEKLDDSVDAMKQYISECGMLELYAEFKKR